MFHFLAIPVVKAIVAHYAATHAAAVHPLSAGLVATTPSAAVATGQTAAAGAAAHAVAAHAVSMGAAKAGTLAGKAAATHAGVSAAGSAGPVLPVHVIPYHAVIDAAMTTTAVSGATSAALSPTMTHAMRRFAEKFAMGYGIARLKRQHCERVDFRTIRSWFRAHERAGIPVTATGVVRDGRFWPGDCFADGASAVLQGFFNPSTKSLSDGRLLLNVQTVSSPVRKQHGGSGLAFYLSAPSGL